MYRGDFSPGQNIDIFWNSYNSLGAPVTRSQGTITVYKDNGTTETSTGVTDTLNFDSKTGLHLARVSSASSTPFYTAGSDFAVYVSGDTIDGQFFAGVVGTFSLANRHFSIATYAELTAVPTATGPTIPQMVQWNYTLSRSSQRQTATAATVYTSANTLIATSNTTDDGSSFDAKAYS